MTGCVPFLDVSASIAEMRGDLDAALARVLDSGRFVLGPEVEAFERAFAPIAGCAHAVGVGNGLDALAIALEAAGVGPGDEVIVPAHTFIATWLAVGMVGAVPVPAEPAAGGFQVTLETVLAAVTARTRAIIVVHLYGEPVEIEPIAAFARRRGLALIEDAAQAHGAKRNGAAVGSFGDAAAFSFYPTKNLGAFGDGGCVTTNDGELAAELRLLRNCGATANYEHVVRGFNSRLDPLQAAILRWKLGRLDAWNERRSALAAIYLAELADARGLTLPAVRPWATPVWHAFPVCVHDGLRDALQRALLDDGVETNVHYRVPIHRQPCYAGEGWRLGAFPASKQRAEMLLSLPLDPFHTDDEILRVSAAVRGALRRLRSA